MSRPQIALVNVARAKTAFEDPAMRGFVARLEDMNALADRSPGFVWRQSSEPDDYLRPYEDQRILFNLSVWESIEHVKQFVYGPAHAELLRRRDEWFERMEAPHLALWWVPQGHRPGVDEAQERLAHLQAQGPTSFAFSFRKTFAHELYDTIGRTYNAFRNADPRIVAAIHELLGLPRGSRVADIGAGTGNYSNALARLGYSMFAVEPSAAMRAQAAPCQDVRWLAGAAQSNPLADASVDGVVAMLAIHHFPDLRAAAAEMRRICPAGPIVLLTIDPRRGERCWFEDYFPALHRRMFDVFLPVEELIPMFAAYPGTQAAVSAFALPADLSDLNMHAGWNRPEIYLDEAIRRGMSGFALAEPGDVSTGLDRLRVDLASGAWDGRHGAQRRRPSCDLGFVFLKSWRGGSGPDDGHG
jgi:SAM-dependent methyltransferase/heme-degrading monooxygenase HmoA